MIRRTDFHLALANSAALREADIWDEPGTLRGEDGGPDGRVTQEAMQRLARWTREALSDHEIQELQLKAAAIAASRGVTSVHEMSMPLEAGERDLAVFLAQRSRLPVDAVPIVATTDIPRVIDLGLGAIGGDLPVDGSIGARTAALAAPYADGTGHGTAYFSDDELVSFFHGGHAAGLQVGVHAIGDRAIDQVLTAWERVYQALDSRQRRHFRARRHRVEHFEMASEGAVERAAMLGLAVSVQPVFDAWWGGPGGLYEVGVGRERAAGMNPIRTMIERGIEVGAGSDTPITPLDPLLAVAALESHHDPRQRLSRAEAIRLHTIGSARLAHQEEKKGALEPGMHADFVAYDADPFEASDARGDRADPHGLARSRGVRAPDHGRSCHSFRRVGLTAGPGRRYRRTASPPRRRRTEDPRGGVENVAPRRHGPKRPLGPHLCPGPPSADRPRDRGMHRRARRVFSGAHRCMRRDAAVQSARDGGVPHRSVHGR